MTLRAALKTHLACPHTIEVKYLDGKVSVRHKKEPTTYFPLSGDGPSAGSALFHAIARELIDLPAHSRIPLLIADEQYESFLAG